LDWVSGSCWRRRGRVGVVSYGGGGGRSIGLEIPERSASRTRAVGR
jgi:hypothetical protein